MKATLYTIQGSHPGIAARLMLERKGIPYRKVLLPPGLSRRIVKRLGFPGDRTPALKMDGRKVQGSTVISRELDRLQPDPPLYPADPEKRRLVEEAEHWGDGDFQQIPRTLIWWAFKRDRSGMESFLANAPPSARFGLPARLAVKTTKPIISLAAKLNQADDAHARADLEKLPAALDRIDRWIAEGVLNGEALNAADYQIAPTIRLLMTFDDLRPLIQGRPAAALADRVPEPVGKVPPVVPREWVAGLRPAAAL